MGRREEDSLLTARANAVKEYKTEHGSVTTAWTFEKLEKEVKEANPDTKNILAKMDIYHQYLNESQALPGSIDEEITRVTAAQKQLKPEDQKRHDAYSTKLKNLQEKKTKYYEPLEKNKKRVKAAHKAVATYQKKHGSLTTEWTFKKLKEEVEASNPKTKNLIEKRKIYQDYLKEIGTSEVDIEKFAAQTKELAPKVEETKAKEGMNKLSAFMDRVSTQVRGKSTSLSPEVSKGKGAEAKGNSTSRG